LTSEVDAIYFLALRGGFAVSKAGRSPFPQTTRRVLGESARADAE
jgi:hypothetical protein